MTRTIKIILLLNGIILFCNSADAQSQMQMNAEACGKSGKAEAKMTRMLERIYREYKQDTIFIEKMKSAQAAWKNFYEAEFEAEFPLEKDENPSYKYGSVYPMCFCATREKLIYERIKQLKVWIDGTEEGNVCSGSVKVMEKKAVRTKGKSKFRRKTKNI